MRVVFLGAPGAGKGTQAKEFAAACGIPHLSTGDMLRQAAADGTPVGRRVKPILDAGKLVDDEIMWSVVSERLDGPDCGPGFVLDGFPRTVPQATSLATKLTATKSPLSHVVYLDVPDDELFRRLSARGRADDKASVIRERLKNYALLTEPLTGWYRGKGLLRSIDGTGTPDAVRARIAKATGSGTR